MEPMNLYEKMFQEEKRKIMDAGNLRGNANFLEELQGNPNEDWLFDNTMEDDTIEKNGSEEYVILFFFFFPHVIMAVLLLYFIIMRCKQTCRRPQKFYKI